MDAFMSRLCLVLFGLFVVGQGAEFPLLKVYEFKDGKVISVDAEPNSDLILPDNGNDTERYLVLQCKAPYPVQWIYSGDGIPEFITNTSVNWDVQPIEFVASAGIFRVAEYHTGAYYCRSIQNPALSMHYYLFITGEKLFTAAGGTIFFSRKDPKIRIPCSASNPKVRVTLQKLDQDYVNCPANDTIAFDMKSGFTLKATHIHEPEGEYLCIAQFKGAYKFIEYKLVSSDNPQKPSHQPSREPEDDSSILRRPIQSTSISPAVTGSGMPGFVHHTATPGRPIYSSSLIQQADQRQPKPPPGCKSFPCGRYAYCTLSSLGKPICRCEKHFRGDPYLKCEPECVVDFDCPTNRVCTDNACEDPCPDVCGPSNGRIQSCKVVNHMPVCSYNHCSPSPCGPFSKCEDLRNKAVCSCLPGYHGSPPFCSPVPVNPTHASNGGTVQAVSLNPKPTIPESPASPEDDSLMETDAFQCRDQNECSSDLRCTEFKCSDPCTPNPCGRRTTCRVIDHEPICSCAPGFTKVNQNCLPTNCRSQRDCPDSKSCVRNRCVNPCAGYCGNNTDCIVEGHSPKCYCAEGFIGNPAKGCQKPPEVTTLPTPGVVQPNISKRCRDGVVCGRNAKCIVHKSEPMCRCESGFTGDPNRFCYQIISNPDTDASSVFDEDRIEETQMKFENVRPSTTPRTTTSTRPTRPPSSSARPTSSKPAGRVCFQEDDCEDTRSCLAGSCLDPCKFFNICGENQDCIVKDHKANCLCKPGYPVKLYNNCYKRENKTNVVPCVSSHCGAAADCILTEHGPICRCKPGYVGIAPNCKPAGSEPNEECKENYQCPELLACVNSTCVNPCVGGCGTLARCRVYNHRAKCFCPQGFHGDPRVRCSVPLFKFSTREENVGQNRRVSGATANNHTLDFIDWSDDDDVFETEADTEETPTDVVTLLDKNEDATTVYPEVEDDEANIDNKRRSDLPATQFPLKTLKTEREKASLARFDLDINNEEYYDDSLEFSV